MSADRTAFTWRDFDELARAGEPPRVTFFLPTHVSGPETRQDPIRLKNLLRTADEQLRASGSTPRANRDLLGPVTDLLQDTRFWQHQDRGLALCSAPGFFRSLRLPFPVQELVTTGTRWCLRPLLPVLQDDSPFLLLALSQKEVRLFRCTRYALAEIPLGDCPTNLEEAVGSEPAGRTLQFHTGTPPNPAGRRAAIFHGQGSGKDDARPEVTRFLQLVDEGVRTATGKASLPMVLAAVDSLAADFRRVSRHPHLLPAGVPGNPEGWRPEDLHRAALERAGAHLPQSVDLALASFASAPPGRRVNNLAEAVRAAQDGRLALLFVATDRTLWGQVANDGILRVGADSRLTDQDLLNHALFVALDGGALVFGLPWEAIPGATPIAGMLR